MWHTVAGAPIATAEIFRKSMAAIQQVDGGKEVPRSVEEATASLATMVVISILDDATRRQRERRARVWRCVVGAPQDCRPPYK